MTTKETALAIDVRPENAVSEQILKAAVDLLMAEDEQFCAALVLSCDLSGPEYEGMRGDHADYSLILSGPAGVYRILRDLSGLAGPLQRYSNNDDE